MWVLQAVGKGVHLMNENDKGLPLPPGYQGEFYQWVSNDLDGNGANITPAQFFDTSSQESMCPFSMILFDMICCTGEPNTLSGPNFLSAITTDFDAGKEAMPYPGDPSGFPSQSWLNSLLSSDGNLVTLLYAYAEAG